MTRCGLVLHAAHPHPPAPPRCWQTAPQWLCATRLSLPAADALPHRAGVWRTRLPSLALLVRRRCGGPAALCPPLDAVSTSASTACRSEPAPPSRRILMAELTLITASLGEERSRRGLAHTSARTDSSRSYSSTRPSVGTPPRAGEGSPPASGRAPRGATTQSACRASPSGGRRRRGLPEEGCGGGRSCRLPRRPRGARPRRRRRPARQGWRERSECGRSATLTLPLRVRCRRGWGAEGGGRVGGGGVGRGVASMRRLCALLMRR